MTELAVPAAAPASPAATLIIGIFLVASGAVLALNIGNISARVLAGSSGFTPWGRRRERWRGPNPARLVGACFVFGGIVALISGLIRVA